MRWSFLIVFVLLLSGPANVSADYCGPDPNAPSTRVDLSTCNRECVVDSRGNTVCTCYDSASNANKAPYIQTTTSCNPSSCTGSIQERYCGSSGLCSFRTINPQCWVGGNPPGSSPTPGSGGGGCGASCDFNSQCSGMSCTCNGAGCGGVCFDGNICGGPQPTDPPPTAIPPTNTQAPTPTPTLPCTPWTDAMPINLPNVVGGIGGSNIQTFSGVVHPDGSKFTESVWYAQAGTSKANTRIVNGSSNPLTATDAWSGQFGIGPTPTLSPFLQMQEYTAEAEIALPGGTQFTQTIWGLGSTGNIINVYKYIPFKSDGSPDWSTATATAWEQHHPENWVLPGIGPFYNNVEKVVSFSGWAFNGKYSEYMWIKKKGGLDTDPTAFLGYSRSDMPIGSDGKVVFTNAWTGGFNLNAVAPPGSSGPMRDQTDFVWAGKWYQYLIRDDVMYWRQVDLTNGTPNYATATGWSSNGTTAWLPGNGPIEAFSVLPYGTQVVESLWRNNKGYNRVVSSNTTSPINSPWSVPNAQTQEQWFPTPTPRPIDRMVKFTSQAEVVISNNQLIQEIWGVDSNNEKVNTYRYVDLDSNGLWKWSTSADKTWYSYDTSGWRLPNGTANAWYFDTVVDQVVSLSGLNSTTREQYMWVKLKPEYSYAGSQFVGYGRSVGSNLWNNPIAYTSLPGTVSTDEMRDQVDFIWNNRLYQAFFRTGNTNPWTRNIPYTPGQPTNYSACPTPIPVPTAVNTPTPLPTPYSWFQVQDSGIVAGDAIQCVYYPPDVGPLTPTPTGLPLLVGTNLGLVVGKNINLTGMPTPGMQVANFKLAETFASKYAFSVLKDRIASTADHSLTPTGDTIFDNLNYGGAAKIVLVTGNPNDTLTIPANTTVHALITNMKLRFDPGIGSGVSTTKGVFYTSNEVSFVSSSTNQLVIEGVVAALGKVDMGNLTSGTPLIPAVTFKYDPNLVLSLPKGLQKTYTILREIP